MLQRSKQGPPGRQLLLFVGAAVISSVLGGCAMRFVPEPPRYAEPMPVPRAVARFGEPRPAWRVGTGAWTSRYLHGRRTASGEPHNAAMLEAASPNLPLPSYARVDNLESGRSLIVRVNDRKSASDGRIISVSRRSAELLGFARSGLARVRVSPLGPAPRPGDQARERAFLARQAWAKCRTIGTVEAVGCVTQEWTAPRRRTPRDPIARYIRQQIVDE